MTKKIIIKIPFYIFFIFSCSSAPQANLVPVTIPDDFFGIVHAGRIQSSEEYRLLDELGAAWILSTFYWGSIENIKGNYNWI